MTRAADLLIANGTAILPGGRSAPVDIVVADGRISSLVDRGEPIQAHELMDASGMWVLPGVIDPHFQSGNLNGVEDFATESRAAAVGGVTTILRMHRSLDPYAATFASVVAEYEQRAWADFAFHLALMTEEHLEELPALVDALGVTSFKTFTAYKHDMPRSANLRGVDDGLLFAILEAVAALGAVALVHCENQEINDRRLAARQPGGDGLRAWEATRPPEAEAEAMLRVGYLASLVDCPLYLVHCSCRLALDVIRHLKRTGARVRGETIIHYLTHTYDAPVGLLGKVAPPLRSEDDIAALWDGIGDGTIDGIGSDHVPLTRETKLGSDIWETKLGLPGTGLILPVLLDKGVHEGRLTMTRVVELTAENPARFFGLSGKGRLTPGADADIVVVDLDRERIVTPADLHGASDWSLYDGQPLRGWPVATISRGRVVARHGHPVPSEGHGRFLRRAAAPQSEARG